VVLALLALSCLAPVAAMARSDRLAPDPSPQKAPPLTSPSTPSPDPAPQAATRSVPSHFTPRPTTSSQVTTEIPPRVAHVTVPAQPSTTSSTVAHVSTVTRPKVRHPASVSRVRHPVRPAGTKPVSLSFPLGFFARDLLRLVPGPFRAGAVDHRGGLLLLLSSLAMGVLAVSSFALVRRLKRLEGRTG
jgi:hypothetical protein